MSDTTHSSQKKGSRWDRSGSEDDHGAKRKLPSDDRPQPQDDEPSVKKSSLDGKLTAIINTKKDTPKLTMSLGGASGKESGKPAPIKMALGSTIPKETQPAIVKPKPKVAQVFNADDSSDEEEMPPEAKMRMRNLGKDTPTAAGPNSFGKNRLGFCDRQKVIQKEMQKQMDDLGDK